jgi:hypothetical protein
MSERMLVTPPNPLLWINRLLQLAIVLCLQKLVVEGDISMAKNK